MTINYMNGNQFSIKFFNKGIYYNYNINKNAITYGYFTPVKI
jgi:hypothetical protein